MIIRPYDSARDAEACRRIWQEVGWIRDEPLEALDWFWTHAGQAFIAELNGRAESLVTSTPGDLAYLQERLPFACITSVATSHVARRQGIALRLTAHVVAEAMAQGAIVCGLGMFEQGYYNRLGFGTGVYTHYVTLPLQELLVEQKPRPPQRLGQDDWEAIHAARLKRRRGHGSASLYPPAFTRGRMHESRDNAFGLGYADDPDGGLTHLLWITTHNPARGPYHVKYLIYRTREQFLELLALLKSLGDQIYTARICEPPEIQLQDLIRQPFRWQSLTSGSGHHVGINAAAWSQLRICDLAACLAQTHLPGPSVRFNLRLHDPIRNYLLEEAPWRGIGGEYIVTLGPESSAIGGQEARLPTMEASVNAFTRLWLGVRPPSGLAVTDELRAPESLLQALDELLRLPPPHPDWDF